MASNPLIGTWRLLSWENRSVLDVEVSYPLGKDAVGYIMYVQDGYMSVLAIMWPDRAKFAAEDLFGGVAEERERKPPAPTCPIAAATSSVGTLSCIEWS
jgi:hypothetical protein